MDDVVLRSSWDTLLVAAPFAGLLFISLFGLDPLMYSPRKSSRTQRPASGIDEDGQPIICDPDGRRWRTPRPRR